MPELAPDISSTPIRLSLLNRSAVKAFALQVSKEKKGGKFTRVSEDFLTDVEASVDAVIRAIGNTSSPLMDGAVVPDHDISAFVTGRAQAKMKNALETVTATIIQRKVCRHPSIGVTLKS